MEQPQLLTSHKVRITASSVYAAAKADLNDKTVASPMQPRPPPNLATMQSPPPGAVRKGHLRHHSLQGQSTSATVSQDGPAAKGLNTRRFHSDELGPRSQSALDHREPPSGSTSARADGPVVAFFKQKISWASKAVEESKAPIAQLPPARRALSLPEQHRKLASDDDVDDDDDDEDDDDEEHRTSDEDSDSDTGIAVAPRPPPGTSTHSYAHGFHSNGSASRLLAAGSSQRLVGHSASTSALPPPSSYQAQAIVPGLSIATTAVAAAVIPTSAVNAPNPFAAPGNPFATPSVAAQSPRSRPAQKTVLPPTTATASVAPAPAPQAAPVHEFALWKRAAANQAAHAAPAPAQSQAPVPSPAPPVSRPMATAAASAASRPARRSSAGRISTAAASGAAAATALATAVAVSGEVSEPRGHVIVPEDSGSGNHPPLASPVASGLHLLSAMYSPTPTPTPQDDEPDGGKRGGSPDGTEFEVSSNFDGPGFLEADEDWTRGELLGSGSYGQVFKAFRPQTGELFAVKVVKCTSPENARLLASEIHLMRALRHPNIVEYLGARRTGGVTYVFMELVPGGTVASFLKQFGAFREPVIRAYIRQVLAGVAFLHSRHVLHRDIKGANILLTTTGTVKLADFGCATQLLNRATHSLEDSLKALRGSVPWMAPEVIRQSGHVEGSDIWSVGCTVIEMATAKRPWPEFRDNLSAMFHVATTGQSPPVPPSLSPAAQDFLQCCFAADPAARWSAARLLDHPFISAESPAAAKEAAAAAAVPGAKEPTGVRRPSAATARAMSRLISPISVGGSTPGGPAAAAGGGGTPRVDASAAPTRFDQKQPLSMLVQQPDSP